MMITELTMPDPAEAKDYFRKKIQFTTGPVELNRMMNDSKTHVVVVDVRAAEDYDKGHIPGAINLPKDKWQTFQGLEKNKINALYCYTHVCHLAATAAVQFAEKDFPVMEMDGGFEAWKQADLPIEAGGPSKVFRAAA